MIGFSLNLQRGKRLTPSLPSSPYAAHLARMRSAAPNASGYYTGQDYTVSFTQAGKFVDAFGGALTYTSPNVQASPTRVVDVTSGMVYVSADGAEDTAIGSAGQNVTAYTALCRSPQATWNTYAGVLETTMGDPNVLGLLGAGSTAFHGGLYPRSVHRNGMPVSPVPFNLAPIRPWVVLTVFTRNPTNTSTLGIAQFNNGLFLCLHLACLLTWDIDDPDDDEVEAAEEELSSYYGPLLATNP